LQKKKTPISCFLCCSFSTIWKKEKEKEILTVRTKPCIKQTHKTKLRWIEERSVWKDKHTERERERERERGPFRGKEAREVRNEKISAE
jgi:hypothetical protein